MTIKFKKVQSNDEIDKVSSLADITWREHYKNLLTREQIDYMLDKFLSHEAIDTHIKEGEIYLLINVDGVDVGFIAYEISDKFIFLDKFYILENFRNKGLGRMAVNNLTELAKNFQKSGVYLTVNKYNTDSIKAYKAFGFTTEAVAVTDIGGGFIMDDYRMYKFLKK